jgi:hypothetical protein
MPKFPQALDRRGLIGGPWKAMQEILPSLLLFRIAAQSCEAASTAQQGFFRQGAAGSMLQVRVVGGDCAGRIAESEEQLSRGHGRQKGLGRSREVSPQPLIEADRSPKLSRPADRVCRDRASGGA